MNNIRNIIGALLITGCTLISCSDKDLGSAMSEVFPISSIVINSTDYDAAGDTICMLKNQTLQLTWNVKPDNVTNSNVVWTSAYDSIAKVTSDGAKTATVTAGKNLGVTMLNVTPEVGFGNTASTPSKIIKVIDHIIYVTGVTITNTPTKKIAIGDTYQLTASYTPSNATFKRCKWVSSNPSIATVDANGIVTGVADGSATITATANDLNPNTPPSVSTTVTIEKVIPIENIVLITETEMSQLGYGQDYQMKYTLTPANATTSLMTWSSDNTSVASVSSTGLIHVNSMTNGSAVITASYKTVTKSVTITVAEGRLCYSFANGVSPWALSNSATATSDGTKASVAMGASGTKYRADLSLVASGSGKTLTITPATYRYLAVKIRPSAQWVAGTNSAGTIKLELFDSPATIGNNNLGTINSANNSYTILNGTSISNTTPNVIYYDLQGKYDSKTPTDWTKFSLVQFKFVIADFISPATSYDIYWVRTFKTLSDLNAFAQQ